MFDYERREEETSKPINPVSHASKYETVVQQALAVSKFIGDTNVRITRLVVGTPKCLAMVPVHFDCNSMLD
jgi:hypothetical protein